MLHPYCQGCCSKCFHVEIRRSNIDGAGLGLFAYNPSYDRGDSHIVFKRGDFIAPYCGEEISEEEMNYRYTGAVDEADSIICPYVVRTCEDTFVDGALVRGPAVYGNDAKGCTNTSNLRNNAALCQNPELGAYATKTIRQGEEIFIGYGKSYWEGLHCNFETVYTNKKLKTTK
jgi:hypothetical protein